MATHKYIDRICLGAALLALLLTATLLWNGAVLGTQGTGRTMGYESRLFDTGRVHTIEIVMDDWETFLADCENEEYSPCSVVIDGEAYQNVGLRAKGNTSLSSVSRMGSDRYSFKLEFDQYESGKSYYGLDKLCLNNLIQDNTMMKDYLVYQMMAKMGVPSPLCSFVFITVNGQDWGLYLAVEAVEDGFLQRNYGSSHGELYKPDAMNMGGGRGNGRDFGMEQFDLGQAAGGPGADGAAPENVGPENPAFPGMPEGAPGGMDGGMGSADVKLQYIDDDPDSYANIFDSAKTNLTDADRDRLIDSLQKLSTGEEIERAVDMEEVLRYFAVHNFVVNGDSYTGSMIHNYYLYEEDGRLSMLPWDYNLAFGGFQTGDADSAVNESIDKGAELTDRPMIAWIFSDETYTQQYHQLMEELLSSVDITGMIDQTAALISPYVERDPGKFCTAEEFETGVAALKQFVALRSESVSRQLAGDREPVDASGLDLSDMGSMDMGGMGGDHRGGPGQMTASGARPEEEVEGDAGDTGERPVMGLALPESAGENRPAHQPGEEAGGPGSRALAGGQNTFPNGTGGQSEAWGWLALSALVLLAGLLLAKRWRRG